MVLVMVAGNSNIGNLGLVDTNIQTNITSSLMSQMD